MPTFPHHLGVAPSLKRHGVCTQCAGEQHPRFREPPCCIVRYFAVLSKYHETSFQNFFFPRLFAGVTPRVLWISVGGAIFLGVYEAVRHFLDDLSYEDNDVTNSHWFLGHPCYSRLFSAIFAVWLWVSESQTRVPKILKNENSALVLFSFGPVAYHHGYWFRRCSIRNTCWCCWHVDSCVQKFPLVQLLVVCTSWVCIRSYYTAMFLSTGYVTLEVLTICRCVLV